MGQLEGIAFENVSVAYRPFLQAPKVVLEGVNLKVSPGEVAVFVGPNGAGKTTLMRLILGLVAPFEGCVCSLGLEPAQHRPQIMRRAGVLLNAKRGFEPRWTPRDALEFAAVSYGVQRAKTRVEEMLDRFRLRPYEHTYISALSTGTRQRLALAFTLVHDPDLWILDEPTLGLDVDSRRILLDEIQTAKRQEKVVLLTSHDPSLVNQSFDRAFFIRDGRVQEEMGQGETHRVRLRLADPKRGERYEIVSLEKLGEVIQRLKDEGVEIRHLESVSVLEKSHVESAHHPGPDH